MCQWRHRTCGKIPPDCIINSISRYCNENSLVVSVQIITWVTSKPISTMIYRYFFVEIIIVVDIVKFYEKSASKIRKIKNNFREGEKCKTIAAYYRGGNNIVSIICIHICNLIRQQYMLARIATKNENVGKSRFYTIIWPKEVT